jgi:hypothetical protein
MTPGKIPIRFTDESQESEPIQKMAAQIAKILTPNEELFYVALQNRMAISMNPNAVAATSNRIIIYDAKILGRASFVDFQWQDVANTRIEQGMMSSQFLVSTVDGRAAGLGELDKEQAKRLYGICQQLEQEWREKRRIREMEQARAASGGISIGGMPGVTGAAESASSAGEDPVAKLAKAKAMLDQGLISEAEYDTLKAKILSSI